MNSDLDEYDQETIADGSGGLILVWSEKYTDPLTNKPTTTVKAKKRFQRIVSLYGGVEPYSLVVCIAHNKNGCLSKAKATIKEIY